MKLRKQRERERECWRRRRSSWKLWNLKERILYIIKRNKQTNNFFYFFLFFVLKYCERERERKYFGGRFSTCWLVLAGFDGFAFLCERKGNGGFGKIHIYISFFFRQNNTKLNRTKRRFYFNYYIYCYLKKTLISFCKWAFSLVQRGCLFWKNVWMTITFFFLPTTALLIIFL